MRASGNLSLYFIDFVGGSMVAACVVSFLWLLIVRSDATASEVREMRELIATAKRDNQVLHAACDRQRELLESNQAAVAARGQLPTQTPIEDYFQALSAFASDHGLRVIRNQPLAPMSYPGLLEQRYAYEVAGSLPAVVAFLQSIENTGFWADVSYLSIERGTRPEKNAANERVAVLTVSLFSARPVDHTAEDGGA